MTETLAPRDGVALGKVQTPVQARWAQLMPTKHRPGKPVHQSVETVLFRAWWVVPLKSRPGEGWSVVSHSGESGGTLSIWQTARFVAPTEEQLHIESKHRYFVLGTPWLCNKKIANEQGSGLVISVLCARGIRTSTPSSGSRCAGPSVALRGHGSRQ